VRAFTQDDAHIFCTEDQVTAESIASAIMLSVIAISRVRRRRVSNSPIAAGARRLGRGLGPAEAALRDAVEAAGLSYTLNPARCAFYGLSSNSYWPMRWAAIAMRHVCSSTLCCRSGSMRAMSAKTAGGTVRQYCIGRSSARSMRFIGVLIEHYAGRFPLWAPPVQIVVASITSEAANYAGEVRQGWQCWPGQGRPRHGNEKINYKVANTASPKCPIMLVVGGREAANRSVALRRSAARSR